ncbi:hypothetical protein GT352_32965 [Streptomyces sp. SID1046]|uniref:hypothetical protein n=1 Tax=Streptomyces sp. SID1046 TaxID=2690249 RepID=UPI0013712BDC|nr:hypothetical protein [Streptomyces sp. SID1046]MYV78688.1 hypothetical protein [Streptomyces sp. SID1046]
MSQHHPAPATGGDPLPTDVDLTNPLTAQVAVFAMLAGLAELHPTLPGGYITTSQCTPAEAHVLLDSPADLEAWRQATHTDVLDVQLTEASDGRKLLFAATVGRIGLRVFTVFGSVSSAVTA